MGYIDAHGWHKPTGFEFEDEVVSVFKKYSEKMGTLRYFKEVSGTDLDTKQGTDLFVDGIPVDITSNFSEKRKMITLEDEVDVNGTAIKFGIRLGNGHITFKTPVMVVGIDASASFLNSYMDIIISEFAAKVDQIMDIINQRFYDYCDDNDIIPEEVVY